MSHNTIDIRSHPNQIEELTRIIRENLACPDSDVIQFNAILTETGAKPTTISLYGSHTCLFPTDYKLTIVTGISSFDLKSAFNSGRFRLDSYELTYDATKISFFYAVTYFK